MKTSASNNIFEGFFPQPGQPKQKIRPVISKQSQAEEYAKIANTETVITADEMRMIISTDQTLLHIGANYPHFGIYVGEGKFACGTIYLSEECPDEPASFGGFAEYTGEDEKWSNSLSKIFTDTLDEKISMKVTAFDAVDFATEKASKMDGILGFHMYIPELYDWRQTYKQMDCPKYKDNDQFTLHFPARTISICSDRMAVMEYARRYTPIDISDEQTIKHMARYYYAINNGIHYDACIPFMADLNE